MVGLGRIMLLKFLYTVTLRSFIKKGVRKRKNERKRFQKPVLPVFDSGQE